MQPYVSAADKVSRLLWRDKLNIDLKNRVALVIGGTDNPGTAICKQLFLSGARVVTAWQDENIESWCAGLAGAGIQVSTFKADITDFNECTRLVSLVEETIGPIDIIINSQNIHESIPFDRMSRQQWGNMISENIDAVFNVCRSLAEGMGNRGFGRIINISSIISRMGMAGHTHQAAAKAGVHGFTMALAQELARKGVTVNTVSPGLISSGNTQEAPDTGDTAEEVAYLVDFLCSDQAGYINGADIAINGGQYMY